MSKYRFELEDHIYNCWRVVDDFKTVHSAHQDRREMSVDEMSNVLMGLEHLYRIKFEALFECFEKHLMEVHELKALYEEEERLNEKFEKQGALIDRILSKEQRNEIAKLMSKKTKKK